MVLSTNTSSWINPVASNPVSSFNSLRAQTTSDSLFEILPLGKLHELDSIPLTNNILSNVVETKAQPRTGIIDLYLPNFESASAGFSLNFQMAGHCSSSLFVNCFIFKEGNSGLNRRRKSW
ncbi:unnamed protein product [Ambrosiozyma monospora]|uniref:Unnamed protein product n=1 Tax=Ambrosiozyma monospora TaxID=43982 RepID=A0ACB5TQJ5_AMBMO|nr:unnamed protein product [Ambrosiozyma monospora]